MCDVINSTMMTCPCPAIELSEEVAGPAGRKKRHVVHLTDSATHPEAGLAGSQLTETIEVENDENNVRYGMDM